MLEYRLYEENKFDRHCGFYLTYGITAFENGGLVRKLGDISVDKNKVARMVAIFNEEQLDPAHLSVSVEDFLYDFEI